MRQNNSMFDDIVGNLGEKFGLGDKAGPLLQMIVERVKNHPGGIQGLLNLLQGKGLGEMFQSWVGTGENKPMEQGQVDEVLGEGFAEEAAQKLDLQPDQVKQATAEALPQAVDKLTPGGEIPDFGGLMDQAKGMLGGLFG